MKNLRFLVMLTMFTVGSTVVIPATSFAHCQIPCGIYNDHARILSMLEDAKTIEKSDKLINELSGKTDPLSQNQLTRWIINKENHAQKIISTICDYFLTQRVKPEQKDYADRLIKHHAVIIAAMQTKQNADTKSAIKLKETIQALLPYYSPALQKQP